MATKEPQPSTVGTGRTFVRATGGTLGAAGANTAIAWAGGRLLAVPAGYEPLQLERVALFTVVGCLAAAATFALVQQAADTPEVAFLRVATVALVVSFVPDVWLLVEPSAVPGTTVGAVLVLMLMHAVAAAIIVPALLGGWPGAEPPG